jgi:tetratricopeptide (TPR) repeat protein
VFRLVNIIVFLGLLSTTQNIAFAQSTENFENALKAYNRGDVDTTYIYLRNALEDNPAHLPSKILMGRILVIRGRYDDAMVELNEAKEFGADVNLVVPILAEALLYSQRYEQLAELSTDKLIKESLFEVKLLKGSAHFNLNKTEQAFKEYQQALTLYPSNVRALNSLAALNLQNRNFKQAKQLIAQSIAQKPSDARTIHLQGQFAKLNGDFETAKRFFEKAYSISPINPVIKRSLATAYAQENDPRASSIVNEILEQSPNDPFALLLKGRLLSQNDNSEAAQEAYDDLIQRLTAVPEDVSVRRKELYFVAGLAAYLSGNYESAIIEFERYIVDNKNNVNALGLMADTYTRLNQHRKAQLLLENNLALVKKDINLSLSLCELFIQSGKIFKCSSLLEQVPAEIRQSERAQLMHVRTLQQSNKPKEALDLFRLSFPKPDAEPFRYTFITLLLANNLIDEALTQTEKALNETPDEIAYTLLKSQILYQQEAFTASLEAARSVMNRHPENKYGLSATIRALLALEEYKEAESIATNLLERYPTDIQTGLFLAQALFFQNKLERALDVLLGVKPIATNNPLPLELLARVYVQQGEWEKARKELEALTRKYLLVPEYHLALADVHFNENNIEAAKKELSIVYGVWVDSPLDLYNLSQQHYSMNDVKGAHRALQRAYDLDKENLLVATELVRAKLRIEENEAAFELAKTLLDDNPESSVVNVRYAESLKAKNRLEQAQRYFTKALELDNWNTDAAAQLYQMALSGVSTDQFKLSAAKVIKAEPQHLFMRRLLADFLLVAGENENALEHYLMLSKQDSVKDKSGIYNNLANIYAKSNPALALEYATKAVDNNDAVADFVDTKGWLLAKQTKFNEALPYLRQAFALNADSPTIRYHLAYALFNLDRKTEAADELNAALRSEKPFDERDEAISLLNQL